MINGVYAHFNAYQTYQKSFLLVGGSIDQDDTVTGSDLNDMFTQIEDRHDRNEAVEGRSKEVR